MMSVPISQSMSNCYSNVFQIDCAECVRMYLFKYHFVCVCLFVSCTLDVHVLTSLSFLDHVSDVLFCMLQQDMNIPQASPEPSALFITSWTSTMAIIVQSKRLSSVSVKARICRPVRQLCLDNCTQQIRNFIDSGEASIMSLTRVMDSLANFCTT